MLRLAKEVGKDDTGGIFQRMLRRSDYAQDERMVFYPCFSGLECVLVLGPCRLSLKRSRMVKMAADLVVKGIRGK